MDNVIDLNNYKKEKLEKQEKKEYDEFFSLLKYLTENQESLFEEVNISVINEDKIIIKDEKNNDITNECLKMKENLDIEDNITPNIADLLIAYLVSINPEHIKITNIDELITINLKDILTYIFENRIEFIEQESDYNTR